MCGVPKLTHSYSTHSAAFKRLGDHRRGQCWWNEKWSH
jgi:hypothetical protein